MIDDAEFEAMYRYLVSAGYGGDELYERMLDARVGDAELLARTALKQYIAQSQGRYKAEAGLEEIRLVAESRSRADARVREIKALLESDKPPNPQYPVKGRHALVKRRGLHVPGWPERQQAGPGPGAPRQIPLPNQVKTHAESAYETELMISRACGEKFSAKTAAKREARLHGLSADSEPYSKWVGNLQRRISDVARTKRRW